ncbi:MAG: protease inhibitor I42 family protein [Phycisphaerales bacterium]|jgi:inhibitor of cysteine peptidase|nr:protease inhibitor I42 family protein [Phycisphaerales bacterium]
MSGRFWSGIGLAAVCLVVLLAGCATSAPAGRPLQLAVGTSTQVVLPATAGTGYVWTVNRSASEGLQHVELRAADGSRPAPDRLGGPRDVIWHIEGRTPGDAVVQFEYHRPWEAGVAPARTATYRVTVR